MASSPLSPSPWVFPLSPNLPSVHSPTPPPPQKTQSKCQREPWNRTSVRPRLIFISLVRTASLNPIFVVPPFPGNVWDQVIGHRWICCKWHFLQPCSSSFSFPSFFFFFFFFFQAHWTEGKWHLITGEQSRSSANYDPGSSVIISN